MEKSILKAQAKRKFLKAFEDSVKETISGISSRMMNDELAVSLLLKADVVDTSQGLKEQFTDELSMKIGLSKKEIDSLIDEAATEMMNQMFESW